MGSSSVQAGRHGTEEALLLHKPPMRSSSAFLLALALVSYLAFSSVSAAGDRARPLSKLHRPVVVLVSSDGFRFGYQHKTRAPNIHRLINNGTEAETGLIPVFPTLTFPNHYSIATGLFPPHHGIINNYFPDPVTGDWFSTASHDPKWWLGEPLWQTVAAHGLNAAAFFWAGSEVKKGAWDCPPAFCPKFNKSVTFEQRVDRILAYFDLPPRDMPVFVALYLEDPDSQGHVVGPDDPAITEAVAHVDRVIGRLIAGLETRGIFEDVSLILLGDHGMVGNCGSKVISLQDLSPYIELPAEWVLSESPLLAIRPTSGVSPADVVMRMNEGLSSGKVENGRHLKMYLKEELPERLHYAESERIPPVIGMLDEGYKVVQRRSNGSDCSGAHGYDNAFFSMRTIFVAHGPRFARGRKVPSFQNVEVYNIVTSILGIGGAPNNGSDSFPNSLLLPKA